MPTVGCTDLNTAHNHTINVNSSNTLKVSEDLHTSSEFSQYYNVFGKTEKPHNYTRGLSLLECLTRGQANHIFNL